MLEVTSAAVETQLGVDFACIYKESSLSKWVYVGTCFFFFSASCGTSSTHDIVWWTVHIR